MSYKTEFASNNTDLQTILDMVNGLPDKVKKCKVYVKTVADVGNYTQATVTIGDTTYYASADQNPDTIIEVESGTEITMVVKAVVSIADYATITIDGEKVVSDAGLMGESYSYAVTDDITVELNNGASDSFPYGYINVVTGEVEGDVDVSLVPEIESTFTPTDSGGTTYKSKFDDNNVDLQKMLELAQSLPDAVTLISFTILGTACQAEEGMTWLDWFQSSYFPSGWSVNVTGNYHFSLDNGTTTRRYSLDFSTTIADGVNYVNLISFSIAGTSYQAEEGMTWAEWCESSYNTGSVSIEETSGGSYVFVGSNYLQDAAGNYVLPSDVIQEGAAYEQYTVPTPPEV